MVSFVFRLPFNLILLAYTVGDRVADLVGSVGFFVISLAAGGGWVAFSRTAWEQHHRSHVVVSVLIYLLFACFALRALVNRLPAPSAIVWAHPRRRRVKAVPVPVAAEVARPADRPTVTQALGRLDPALREMIASSRAAAGA